MNAATDKDYIDAKLVTIEARMDGRIASIEASIRGFIELQEERLGRLDDRLTRLEQAVADIKNDLKSLKSTMVITAITTVLAIILGVAAFNATVFSNMLASFESGKNTAAAQAEVKKQSEEIAVIVKQLQEDIQAKKPPEKHDSR